jgi:hypothetical protein
VSNTHSQVIVSELDHLERVGFLDSKGNRYFVQLVSVVMDDPALRKFLGLSGHASDLCCPLCTFSVKNDGHNGFAWPEVTSDLLTHKLRSDKHFRDGLSCAIVETIHR